jgi:CheY-like chemotaxis protein
MAKQGGLPVSTEDYWSGVASKRLKMNINRVVLIDDNDEDNNLHVSMLKRAEFSGELLLIDSALTAFEFFSHADPTISTLVLLGADLPGMSDLQLLEKIAPLVASSRADMVLMLASDIDTKTRARCELLGVRYFLPKPLLADSIRPLLSVRAESKSAHSDSKARKATPQFWLC